MTTETLELGEETDIRPLPEPRVVGLAAEFDNVDDVIAAANAVRETGIKFWDVHSPFAIHGIDAAMGIKPTILPWLVAAGGTTGCAFGLIMTWAINAYTVKGSWMWQSLNGYEFFISGKPLWSLPANIPVIFETTVLFSALTAVFSMILLNKLPMHYSPLFRLERFRRVTDDRFFVVIDAGDPKYDQDELVGLLKRKNCMAIETVEDLEYSYEA